MFGLVFALLFFASSCVHLSTETESSREPASLKRRPADAELVPEQCADRKMYLESQIDSLPTEYVQFHGEEQGRRLPLRCIQFAQKNYHGFYGVCESENGRPKISSVKPCITENYTMLAYNAYHDVMDCFNLDPHDFFLQIMIESGFHLNAINRTGYDSGMAQFTANGIKKVMANNLIERTRRILLESSNPSCQRVSSIVGSFDIEAFSVDKRCSMLSLPKNPYRAMLFNYLHTMRDQILLDRMLTDFPQLSTVLTPKIKRQLVHLAYNRGLMGVKRLLKSYIESRRYFGHEITSDDMDLNKNLSRVKRILRLEPYKRDLLKKAKVRNLSFAEHAVINGASYLSDMSDARDLVRRQLGDLCGDL